MSVETDLVTAVHERLNGDDSYGTALTYDGSEVPVYTGNAPTDASSPYVVIGRPRTRGSKFIGGEKRHEVRQQLRIATSFPKGQGNHFKAFEIAAEADDLLNAAALTAGSGEPHVPNPDKDPIPSYDAGDKEALDLSVNYIFQL